MNRFRDWLSGLLLHGESVLEAPPVVDPDAIEDLRAAFERIALDVAGPTISFDGPSALAAAEDVANACWRLVNGAEEPGLKLAEREPATPAAHLSADVTLRYLPAVWKRAKARGAEQPLAIEQDRVLRKWPLSGVLADLDGEPVSPLEFGGHLGLQMLYAERYVTTRRTGWLPPAGASREWVERIFHERRLAVPSPAPPAEE